ncbi:chromobox protein homolog 5-like isoform X1 [Diorhabda sublineata]|uniref:chromobox protein homolog 5-like isoform X1 n=1 Tax=Diorhabda sublineata TaxID=1163346 RepID=UPI0024E173CB|nr:chromobox protein homolog 5-like isoform X1 [Diorhabda sublineata]
MKRKSGRKVHKSEDDTNGREEKFDENGGATDEAGEENIEVEPKDRKRKSSKSSKKNVSFPSKKYETTIESDPLEDVEDLRKSKDKKKKAKDESSDDDLQNDEDDSQYEVEKIIEEKIIRGIRHYLIRWKGYEEESDTWEPEDTLNCPDIIADFKENKKKTKGKKDKHSKKVTKGESADWDENEDFEVERILEVHHRRDGKREFLVSWKGYSAKDNSWEPEENMNCKDLIDKFMAKVEVAKSFEEKDLRLNRKRVQRLTYNTPETKRRLSKRMSGKERYFLIDLIYFG